MTNNSNIFKNNTHNQNRNTTYQFGKTLTQNLFQQHTQNVGDQVVCLQQFDSMFMLFLYALALALGIGNFWRFPYIAVESGGAYFLIPYVIAVIIMGYPTYVMETSLGQSQRAASLVIFQNISPYFMGLSILAQSSAYFIMIYYTNLISVSLLMFANAAFTNNSWTESVDQPYSYSCSSAFDNEKFKNLLPSEAYFKSSNIVSLTYGPEQLCKPFNQTQIMSVNIYFILALAFCWLYVYFMIRKEITSSNFALGITVLLPIFILIVMFIRAATFDSIWENGFELFIYGPIEGSQNSFEQNIQNGQTQILFSIALGYTTLINNSVYNPDSNATMKQAVIILICNAIFSLTATSCIYMLFGYLYSIDITLSKDKQNSIGLTFIAFPDIMNRMSDSSVLRWIWNVLFFIMIFFLGIGSVFPIIEGIQKIIFDFFDGKYKRSTLAFWICGVGFIMSTLYTTNIGQNLLNKTDTYIPAFNLMGIVIIEIVLVNWIKGWSDKAQKTGYLSLSIYTFGYFSSVILTQFLYYNTEFKLILIILIVLIIFAVFIVIAGLLSKLSFLEFICEAQVQGIEHLNQWILDNFWQQDENQKYSDFQMLYNSIWTGLYCGMIKYVTITYCIWGFLREIISIVKSQNQSENSIDFIQILALFQAGFGWVIWIIMIFYLIIKGKKSNEDDQLEKSSISLMK